MAFRSHPFLLRAYAVLARVSTCYPPLQGRSLRFTHPSATRHPCVLLHTVLPFDLHVLGVPPAFNLSQDQTLHNVIFSHLSYRLTKIVPLYKKTSVLSQLAKITSITLSTKNPHALHEAFVSTAINQIYKISHISLLVPLLSGKYILSPVQACFLSYILLKNFQFKEWAFYRLLLGCQQFF